MLTWLWFIALTAAGWVLAFLCFKDIDKKTGPDKQLASHALLTISIAISWDELGMKIFQWLVMSLPQTGSEINIFTASSIGLVLAGAWLFAPVLLPLLFMDKDAISEVRSFFFKTG